jgi:hypothetical protein
MASDIRHGVYSLLLVEDTRFHVRVCHVWAYRGKIKGGIMSAKHKEIIE